MKQKIIFNIAGFNILVDFTSLENPSFRNDFRTNILNKFSGFIISNKIIKPDFTVNIVQTYIAETIYKKETKASYFKIYRYKAKNIIETYQYISFIDFSMILREIVQKLLATNNGFVMHGSAVLDNNNNAHIFTGDSGAGKSTAMSLLSPENRALGDDSVIIRKEKDRYYLYQTPLFEKNWLEKDHNKYPVKNIYFLEKSKTFNLRKIKDKKTIMLKMTEQLFIKQIGSKDEFIYLFEFIRKFDGFYILAFDKNKNKFLNFFNNEIIKTYEI